jgi:hypothetical protein
MGPGTKLEKYEGWGAVGLRASPRGPQTGPKSNETKDIVVMVGLAVVAPGA